LARYDFGVYIIAFLSVLLGSLYLIFEWMFLVELFVFSVEFIFFLAFRRVGEVGCSRDYLHGTPTTTPPGTIAAPANQSIRRRGCAALLSNSW
jgi:hypothetical protein